MEVFVIIGGIWFFFYIIGAVRESNRKAEIERLVAQMEEERSQNIFTSKIFEDRIETKDIDWDILHFQVKGIVDCPHDNTPVKYIVQLMDITEDRLFIFSTFEDFQHKDSRVFQFESEQEVLPYESTIFKNWVTAARIPVMSLEFPRSGNRKLEAKIFVVNANTDIILTEDIKIFTFNNIEKGYLERNEDREYLEEMIVKSAMLVSASDGDMDEEEAKVVKTWIKHRILDYREDLQDDVKNRLNNYVKDVYHEINNDEINIYDVLEGIDNIATEGEKFELFQVCLDVAQADGEADKAELKIAHDIAKYMHLDEKQFRSMIEKTLPLTMHTGESSDEALLGIDSSMTTKEIKKKLREQYQKWNARVASPDAKIREQAEKMIHLIAEVRKKHV